MGFDRLLSHPAILSHLRPAKTPNPYYPRQKPGFLGGVLEFAVAGAETRFLLRRVSFHSQATDYGEVMPQSFIGLLPQPI